MGRVLNPLSPTSNVTLQIFSLENIKMSEKETLKSLEQLVPRLIESIESMDKKDLQKTKNALETLISFGKQIMLKAQPFVIVSLLI